MGRAATGVLAGLALAAAQCAAAAEPPPAGRSLFDHLVRERVPYPFGALLRHVGAQLEDGEHGVRAVLIPLGRSLQRDAARGAYFRYPRVVAAVVGEPAPGGMALKDRLYLGYHEKAARLEVISYNEVAGRFEFQVVRDYRAGGRAQVRYANRAMCMACHQNGAPIFSRPPWDETQANPRLQRRLRAARRDFYGVALERGAEVPNAIDLSTDRANRLDTVQRLWREGCEPPGRPQAAARCRGEAFAAALKFRLSGDRQIDAQGAGFRDALEGVLRASWQARWPEGLALPSPDLDNRDPLGAGGRRIPPQLDPLAAREPIDLRFGARREDVELFVRNLGGFLTEPDLVELDRWLERRHAATGARAAPLGVPCRVIERQRGQRPGQLQFACVAPPGAQPEVALSGRLQRAGPRLLDGSFDHTAGAPVRVRDVAIRPAAIAELPDGGHEVELELRPHGLALRLADGSRVERVVLRWRAGRGEADVWVADDFAPVARAVAQLAAESAAGASDVFGALPFRRAAVLGALYAKLGAPPRDGCCLDDAGLPPARAVEDSAAARRAALLAPFGRACALCHAGAERFPPGFLHGGDAAVLKKIDACAERMLYRLGMWRLPAEARPKTPMPPVAAYPAADAAMAADLAAMTRYLESRIPARGRVPRDYDALPRCTS